MFARFKKGDYFLYIDSCDSSEWLVCKVTKVANGLRSDEILYYYRVIKSSPDCEDIGDTSRFSDESIFHSECTPIKSADDSSVLARLL